MKNNIKDSEKFMINMALEFMEYSEDNFMKFKELVTDTLNFVGNLTTNVAEVRLVINPSETCLLLITQEQFSSKEKVPEGLSVERILEILDEAGDLHEIITCSSKTLILSFPNDPIARFHSDECLGIKGYITCNTKEKA